MNTHTVLLRLVCMHNVLVGNYMNGNTSRGQAAGVKLSFLVYDFIFIFLLIVIRPTCKSQLKLGNVKQGGGGGSEGVALIRKKGGTLLHYLAELLMEKHPEALSFFDSCTGVWSGAKVRTAVVHRLTKSVDIVVLNRVACIYFVLCRLNVIFSQSIYVAYQT